jgi:hypothetical protein
MEMDLDFFPFELESAIKKEILAAKISPIKLRFTNNFSAGFLFRRYSIRRAKTRRYRIVNSPRASTQPNVEKLTREATFEDWPT